MDIQIISMPFDLGHRAFRCGRGPLRFLEKGVEQRLRAAGHAVAVQSIDTDPAASSEIGAVFSLNRLLAEAVRAAAAKNRFPLVLAGNCNACVGTLAGLGGQQTGLIWLDAHGDFNTPDTTLSGFFDGMGLALAAGRCWRSLLQTLRGFAPVADDRIVHIGARDLDPAEQEAFRAARMTVVPAARVSKDQALSGELLAALDGLASRVAFICLHIDMDVLAVEHGRPNQFDAPGGLPLAVVREVIRAVRQRFAVAACVIASYNPDYDARDEVLEAGVALMQAVV